MIMVFLLVIISDPSSRQVPRLNLTSESSEIPGAQALITQQAMFTYSFGAQDWFMGFAGAGSGITQVRV